jgi:hypothetical protein
MKTFLLIAIGVLLAVDPATVKKINAAKSAAEDAFKKGEYVAAIGHYKYLVDSLGVHEDEVLINLANAYYLAKDTANAYNQYQTVTGSPKTDIRSKALQQLGIMANQQGRAEEALNMFKQAIKAEPSNDDARYNYEMLKKKLEEKKKEEEKQKQNKDQQKQDQENKDQQKQEQEQKEKEQQEKDQQSKDEQNKDQQQKDQQQKDKEQQEKEEKEKQEQEQKQEQEKENAEKEEMPNLDREKLEQMKISEEKARMILEAMKNQEKQYLQQQKRKPTQSRDRNKPDW